jgi:DNA-binding NtrC family response regulator
MQVLVYTRWNRKKAAEILKVSYKALLQKIKDYRVEELYRDMMQNNNKVSHQRSGEG